MKKSKIQLFFSVIVYLSSIKTLITLSANERTCANERTLCVTFAIINTHEGSLSPMLFNLSPGQGQTLIMFDSFNKSE